MKEICIFFALTFCILSCKETDFEKQKLKNNELSMVGHWDNFQQYWLENTETDIHRTDTEDKHRHLSLTITEDSLQGWNVEIREGRNGINFIKHASWHSTKEYKVLKFDGDTLWVKGDAPFQNKEPYKFIRTRMFSGWIEKPMKQYPDSVYRLPNLKIHDQGGMAELTIEGENYTAELTQLIFGHKLPIMKLAIYDMPIDSVQINSRSISYTWLNPEAKRTGINLRKVSSGWTFIEPGFINSDNTKFNNK